MNETGRSATKAGIARAELCGLNERKQALQRSEMRYHAMVEAFDGFIYICSQDFRVEFMNDRLIQRTGREAIGEPCYKVLHDRDSACPWCLNERVWQGETVRWEVQSPKDSRWYYVVNTPIRNPDGTVSKQAMITDITERKQADEALRESEERYRMIVDTSQEGIIAIDAAGQITYVNRRMAELLGQGAAEMLGRSLLDFIDEAARCDVAARLEKRRMGIRERYETIFVRKDGRKMWASLSAAPLWGASGEFSGSFAMISNLTERKRAAEEIEVLNTNLAARASELEIANEELEAFSYTVSHDLRKPLTAIHGYSELVLELYGKNIDEQCRGFVQEILNGAVRMNQLIETLLNFSRKALKELRRETADLGEMAKSIVAELMRAEPLRRASCTIAEGVTAEGDTNLLRVVLDNLLGNAWKYTARNAETLIEFGVIEQNGNPAYFVRDNGVGFDMADADRLFAAFQRLHTAGEFAGIGIGLATVQRIIQRHGGRVWAEGEVGKGATFYFTLG